ncbi:FAD-dependent monooxygenase [Saccharothrix mutabilis subsp. mutabilis]|uniref:FAD-dependent monooxygenase n=1 Tax=Saccharothrix mutabilis subsp. mutabilis TaxID=66855 RepID=A0ABN0TEB4_9PSEU
MAEVLTQTQALVLGGGVAGLLAAAALKGHVERVTVVERDRYDGARPRRGVPQGRHAHLLLARGVRAMESLAPGFEAALGAAGARRVRMPQDLLTYTPFGWTPRFPHGQFLMSCRRPLLESVLRDLVDVEVVQDAEAVGLVGSGGRVTGAVVRSREDGVAREVAADLVVDATGASSKADRWLRDLGRSVRDVVVDPGIRYATALFRPAQRLAGFPAVCVQPGPPDEGHGGVLLPVEEGWWIVSLAGLRGTVPPTDAAGFLAYAKGLRHPLLGRLLGSAEPVGPIRAYGAPPGRLRSFPDVAGFVAVGDAVANYNPLYGHGMTVAAVDALALRDGVAEHGLGGGLARSVRKAVVRATADAWALAVGQDTRYERTFAPARKVPDRVAGWYADRVGAAAAVDTGVAAALLDSYTLSEPLSRLTRPAVARKVLRKLDRPSPEPPLTPEERALLTP